MIRPDHPFIAHVREADGLKQTVETHLHETADLCSSFTATIGLARRGQRCRIDLPAGKPFPMFTDDQLIPISALQHYLFCPRQAALIHLEQAWADNRFTAEGNALHQKAHDGHDDSRPGVRHTRSLPVVSRRLGLAGQCDIVEFHADGAVIPVEYKRGKPKQHDADEAQLCAQAMCLEEMLGVGITEGFLFYGQRKRRTAVEFNVDLRQQVETVATALHRLMASRITPARGL